MPDDSVAIQPQATTPAGPVTLIKTFLTIAPNGQQVESQAVVLVDELGNVYRSMSEETGQAILAMLTQINNTLADGLGGFSR